MERKPFRSIDLDYYNTLDIDDPSLAKLHKIVMNLLTMKCCAGITIEPSSYKGYHIRIQCRVIQCDLCRLVYDDQTRFWMDSKRDRSCRNILWDKKMPANGAGLLVSR